jgi:hypothetical protein
LARASRNARQDWLTRRGAGSMPRVFEDLPHRRRRDLVPQSCQLTVDAPVTPARVVPRHLQHQRPYRPRSPRSPGRAARIGPAPSDQAGMPAQQGLRGDDEPQLAALVAGKQPGQGGQYRPIGPGQPRVLNLTLKPRPGDARSRSPRPWHGWSGRARRASRRPGEPRGRRIVVARVLKVPDRVALAQPDAKT